MMVKFLIFNVPPSPIFPTPSVITPAESQKSQKKEMAGKEWCGPSKERESNKLDLEMAGNIFQVQFDHSTWRETIFKLNSTTVKF